MKKNIISEMIKAKAVLAPMSGITDVPFRLISRKYGCKFAFTEMIDVNGIVYRNKKSFKMLDILPEDRPIGVQLVGQDITKMVDVARLCEEKGFPVIDINAGCPARKVIKGGKGSALLKEPEKLAKMVGHVVGAVNIPVTVKIRSGWGPSEMNYLKVARMVEEAGARAICVHPRTREQMYRGGADHNIVKEVKEAVSIPVFASGNIFSAQSAMETISLTGCDGVYVARGALGKPWIFDDIRRVLSGKEERPDPGFRKLKNIIAEHYLLSLEHYDSALAKSRMYKYITWYLRRYKNIDFVMKRYGRISPGKEALRGFLEALSLDGRKLYIKEQ
ncbi:MAG: tRNA dihydrouridine synthase DusB [Candidatus Omnitrophica bacterium]|nr:tRNA dihydrouridine synthase DusB [Candidatus Omnitrophota bacterium]MDD5487535.1 tRNA dihydrouridine synthase DusB [Candidatus Omnitrophota bacterium]